jgi:type III pantothenate kinase
LTLSPPRANFPAVLLAIDVGNTQTVLGVFEGDTLRDDWRVETRPARTADELAALLRELLALGGLELRAVNAAIVSCVVPPALDPLEAALKERCGVEPLVVGRGVKTGMPIRTDNPREVGADRIVNAVAAYQRFASGCIVVDFGTATTFDCVSPDGAYLGGAIAAGLTISADALYRHAARLQRVELVRPEHVVGKNTVASTQAGLFWGYVGLVDGMVRRMRAEIGFSTRVVATGGLAETIASACETIDEVDPGLTLRGLRLLFDRNRPGG